MRTFLIIIGLFLFIGNSFAQSYEELIEKSYDFVDKGDFGVRGREPENGHAQRTG